MQSQTRQELPKRPNVVLIGMPGVGKSTLGVLLAKDLGYAFIDTDLVLQVEEGMSLGEILAARGIDGFKRAEERCVLGLDAEGAVIAPGGSIVYSDSAMAHLRAHGLAVWLSLSFENLERRLGDLNARGVVCPPGKTLYDLYEERTPLYRHYADAVVECDGREPAVLVEEILNVLKPFEITGAGRLPAARSRGTRES